MTIGTNIQGITSFFLNKKKKTPAQQPQAGAATPMAGYVNNMATQAQPQPTVAPQPAYQSQGLPSTLRDPGQITQAGKMYADRITGNLQGSNPLVQNAQATENTAAARRAYTGAKTTRETLAQTPFAQGSAQYQRAMDQSQATVDAANQAGQNEVNAFTRQTTNDTLQAANNLEDQQFGRAIGERTYQTTQDANLGASIQDPKAKYAYTAMVARGMDPKAAYAAVVGDSGTINEQYRGQSPVATVQQDAEDWIGRTTDLKAGTPEYTKAVRDRMYELDKAQQQPVTDATKQADKAAIEEKIRAGEKLTEKEQTAGVKNGAIPEYTAGNLPKNKLGADLIGKPINIGGTVYTYVQGSRTRTGAGTFTNQERHTDYAEVKNASGASLYVYDGAIHDRPPKKISNDVTPFGF